ncbi:WbqC family protein [Pseudoalteromonas pernae]|uniref:WbqC family protein n=1 Tax=Pseudoalteromonas pernae TaxID=3118054 RepID=UPI003241CE3D
MQPYFLPYIGYWQLLNSVDTFVIYDDIKYTKRGWINRNRVIQPDGNIVNISLPLKSGSDSANINERFLAHDYAKQIQKTTRRLEAFYRKATYFEDGIEVFLNATDFNSDNLFEALYWSVINLKEVLGITTEIVRSSSLEPNSHLKGQDRVLNICNQLKAEKYINPPGGKSLYNQVDFNSKNIELSFLEPEITNYQQYELDSFIPSLSILDVLMFNGVEKSHDMVKQWRLT